MAGDHTGACRVHDPTGALITCISGLLICVAQEPCNYVQRSSQCVDYSGQTLRKVSPDVPNVPAPSERALRKAAQSLH